MKIDLTALARRGMLLSALLLPHFAHARGDESIVSPPEADEALNSLEVREQTRTSANGAYEVTYSLKDDSVTGFGFDNNGPNPVVPVALKGIGLGPTRSYRFSFDDRARQNIMLMLTDVPNEFLSQMMESYFFFFPRKVLPAIQWSTDPNDRTFRVILPTTEEVIFNSDTKEVLRGVLSETGPIDLGPDRFKRKFAAIQYKGSGVVLRVDKRGNDPRTSGTTAVITLGAKTCKVPSAKLFDQDPHGSALFLFPTDEGFNEFLKKTCKMSFL